MRSKPLPSDHPLWKMPNVIITPHCAGAGPYLDDRRTELFIENCVRFNEGRELKNIVDKAKLVLTQFVIPAKVGIQVDVGYVS